MLQLKSMGFKDRTQHFDILDITYYHNKRSAIFFKIGIEERIRIKTRESRLPDALFNCCSTDVGGSIFSSSVE
jgi:hypothetical protein